MKRYSIVEAMSNPDEICRVLRGGGVIVCPTDTVYGLLADATHEQAIHKLLQIKRRPQGKPISVFVDGYEMMDQYVDTTHLTDEMRTLLPGSYTLVFPSLHRTHPLLEAEDGTIGIRLIGKRIPIFNDQFSINNDSRVIARSTTEGHTEEAISYTIASTDFVTTLVSVFGKPLTATSANVSGKAPCYSVKSFMHQLSDKKKRLIDGVIDTGELPHNPPSTVIHLAGHTPTVLRANDQDYLHHETRTVRHESETGDIAEYVYEIVRGYIDIKPIVVLLDGELGGGKTTWTKYFAKLFGISTIVSPTYTYECEYGVQSIGDVTRFKHYDLYNVSQPEDIAYLRITDNCTIDTITCIEWPGQLSLEDRAVLAQTTYLVRILFEYVGERERMISVWWN